MDEAQRILQDFLDNLNGEDPPHHDVPAFLANYRHPCTRARQSAKLGGKGVSTAIDLKERYVLLSDADPSAPDGSEYALVYREGKCKRCGQVARSRTARVVLTSERPPISGRVARD